MYDIITFGTATRDAFLFSQEEFDIEKDKHAKSGRVIALPLEAKVELRDIIFTTGGGATNAAVTFARQGFKTACVCRIGMDQGGKAVLTDLHEERVDASFVQKDHEKPTGYAVILDVGKQGRTVLVYRGSSEYLDKIAVPFDEIKAGWLYIAPLGEHSLPLFEPLLELAQRENIKVAVNPSSTFIKLGAKKVASWLDKIDVFILNREEASYLTGLPYTHEKKIFNKMDKLVKGLVVVTDGPKGVKVSDGKTIWQAGIFKENEVVDRTGAGDAFGSGFVSVLARGNGIEEAIRFGSANATSVVEYVGAKQGILRLKDLSNKRWQGLEIEKHKA